MFICPSCCAENRSTAKFCRKCGIRRVQRSEECGVVTPQCLLGEVAPKLIDTQNMLPTCSACGARVRTTDKFCIRCGVAQPQRVALQTKRCSKCGVDLPDIANFCYVCGTSMSAQQRIQVNSTSQLFSEEDPELAPKFEI